jgi:hypothetical protein
MAGRGFDTSLTEGQLILPAGSQCKTPWGLLGSGQLSSVAHVAGDREIAYTSLFGRLVLKSAVKVKPQELRAAHRAIIRYRFGGSAGAYRATLAGAGASTAIARAVIADELRQARIERNFRVKAPSGKAIASYRESYASTPARLVQVTPAPSWLGHRSRGVAIEGLAPAPVFRISGRAWVKVKTRDGVLRVRALSPTAPLGAFSLSDAWSSIRAALVQHAQDAVFDNWLMRRESAALQWTTCRRDWLPAVGPLELTTELPFLALAS